MPRIDAPEMFRKDLLAGVSVMVAGSAAADPGEPGETLATAVAGGCAALEARVSLLALPRASDQLAGFDDEVFERELPADVAIDVLVIDAAGLFAATSAIGDRDDAREAQARAALIGALELTWRVTQAAVNRAFLPRGQGGRIIFLAPVSGAAGQTHAEAARAGLENLARTLSIEWSRFAITTVAIAPGAATAGGEVAALVAYLASPAGAYFSGCQLDLRGPNGSALS